MRQQNPRVVSHSRVRIEKRQENGSPYFSVVQRARIDRQIDRHFIQLLPADCHLVAFSNSSTGTRNFSTVFSL